MPTILSVWLLSWRALSPRCPGALFRHTPAAHGAMPFRWHQLSSISSDVSLDTLTISFKNSWFSSYSYSGFCWFLRFGLTKRPISMLLSAIKMLHTRPQIDLKYPPCHLGGCVPRRVGGAFFLLSSLLANASAAKCMQKPFYIRKMAGIDWFPPQAGGLRATFLEISRSR